MKALGALALTLLAALPLRAPAETLAYTTAHLKGEIRGQLVRQGGPESAGVTR